MAKPQLYVFAGPNGAGKSTLSADMVPTSTPIFDGDVEFLKLKKFFYDLDDYKIRSSVNDNIFPEWKIEVISKGKDAAFETNFRSGGEIDSVKQFMAAGYQSRLIFMGLDSVEVSIDRVNLRVAKGGHKVSVFDINNNYEQSLINLSQFYDVFTSVHVYQNFQMPGESIQMTPLMNIKSGKIIELANELPEWAKSFYEKITGK